MAGSTRRAFVLLAAIALALVAGWLAYHAGFFVGSR